MARTKTLAIRIAIAIVLLVIVEQGYFVLHPQSGPFPDVSKVRLAEKQRHEKRKELHDGVDRNDDADDDSRWDGNKFAMNVGSFESDDYDESRRHKDNDDEIKNGLVVDIVEKDEDSFKIYQEYDFLQLMEEMHGGVTRKPALDTKRVKIFVSELGKALTFPEYQKWRVEQFTRKVANPGKRSKRPPRLRKYPANMERPSPYLLVDDATMTVDEEQVEKEWQKEKSWRVANGDDDLLRIPEVQRALAKNDGNSIPNIVHFIWFGCRKYRVYHYISMLSAVKIQKPELLLFHTNCKPNGSYWKTFVESAGKTLKIVKRNPPAQIWGSYILRIEHQSDVARLQIMLEVGGIYLDDDAVVLNSLNPLRSNQMVLGEENYDALANTVIMANKDSWFLKRWYQEYQDFNNTRWSEHSCFVPWCLWQFFPTTIFVVKEKMLRPNWEEVQFIYRELWDWTKSYTIHLYARFMLPVDGVKERSLKELAVLNTTYGQISRYIIWDDPKPQNITEWIL